MSEYQPEEIEGKWQDYWEESGTFEVEADPDQPKYYVLDMFPYPSGSGLHVGHVEGYTATDIVARFKRARGYNVLHPMGWDAFGLPAEQYALKTGTHPRDTTKDGIETFKNQLKGLGYSYDWSREINTTDPDYYKWTQWIFLKLYEQDLAYIAEVPVNWCPELGTVLANEEVIDGKSERGGHPVVQKPMRQWMLKITDYADRLLEDLEDLDWPEHLKEMQRNWIGRSRGAELDFPVDPDSTDGLDANIRVFTTRPDTLFGATYMVLAPEHPLVEQVTDDEHAEKVNAYVEEAKQKTELERQDLQDDVTGVFTGAYAINPVNDEKIPIWVADYVLMDYGTGAIMAVPAHDQRDWDFADKYDIPKIEVVEGGDISEEAYEEDGPHINSEFLNGLDVEEAKEKMTDWLEEQDLGKEAINYQLRDWLFSRQRYWGEPIPMIHNEDGEVKPLPEERLPLELPEVESYEPSGTGESPLATIEDWVNTEDPETGQPARRETNTMPQWAGSSWYYLRYVDPHNDEAPWNRQKEDYWMPVDLYVGGAEHAVLHLLYARFWHKVLYDLDLVSTKEPFKRVFNQGMILGRTYEYWEDPDTGEWYDYTEKDEHEDLLPRVVPPKEVSWSDDDTPYYEEDGEQIELAESTEKMSKSRGNVINPVDVIDEYGADSLRLYEMFMGPLDQDKPWDPRAVNGVHRFLSRVWRLFCEDGGLSDTVMDFEPDEEAKSELHKTIEKVTEDTERLDFNTAIAAMMEFVNFLYKREDVARTTVAKFAKLLAPYAPHIAEELWERLGKEGSIANAGWPDYDEELTREETVEIGVQINGNFRGTVDVPTDADKEQAIELARENDNVRRHLDDIDEFAKIIFVPEQIINFVGKG